MRGSRVTEVVQRQTHSLRTSSSKSDPLHSRTRTERASPRLSEGRSPRGAQSNPNPKKLGTRIAELESQLGLAQEELKSLKDQLSTPDLAKKVAQDQLEKKPKKPEKLEKVCNPADVKEKHLTTIQTGTVSNKNEEDSAAGFEPSDDARKETDVFEVPMEEEYSKPVPNESTGSSSSEKNPLSDEICTLKTKLEEKDRDILVFQQQNESLKTQVEEKSAKFSQAVSEIEQLKSRLNKFTQELEKNRNNEAEIKERMEAAEKAKQDMENEMKRLTVQTEQWRKAADAAAAVLSGGADVNCRRISERCGSMDTHYMNSLERLGGYVGSPMIEDTHDVFGSEKRKGSGIRMLGELLKKKGHK